MAKSNRKRKQQIRDQKDAKKFWRVVMISTLILLVLLYILYRSST